MRQPDSKFGTIRYSLGCNQDQLATYLRVSRSLLSLVELKRRFLPTHAELKLLKLYQLILQIQPVPEPLPKASGRAAQRWLQQLQRQVQRQQRLVATLTAKQQAARHSLQCISAIRQQITPNEEGSAVFLNLLQAKANLVANERTAASLALEQVKLQSLEAALATAQQLMG